MASSTHTNPVGFLPYGSSDSSVLFYHSLTTVPTTTTIPSSALIIQGTGSPSHDSELGMLAGTANYRVASLTGGANLDFAGDICFQVQKEWLCQQATGSGGDANPSGNQAPISFLPTVGAACAYYRLAAGGSQFSFNGANTSTNLWNTALSGSPVFHTADKSGFVTVNLGWWGGRAGGRVIMGINGMPLAYGTRNSATLSGLSALMYLGTDRGTAGTFMSSRYMRNLQIATRPPMFATHPKLRKVVFWGDSLVGGANALSLTSTDYYDCQIGIQVAKELASRGVFCGEIVSQSNGGYAISDSDPTPLQAVRATLTATNPTLVVMIAGSNDATATEYSIDSTWNTDLADHVNTILALESCDDVILCGTPSLVGDTSQNTATNKARRVQIDTYKQALGISNCHYVDTYSALGGENPPSYTYQGQISGSNGDIHPRPVGNVAMAKAIANAIINNILK